MIACLFWDLVWGIPGLFLAMPIMAGIRAVCLHTPGLRPWAFLMSTERSLRAWEEEERRAALAAKIVDPEATVVMGDGEVSKTTGEKV
jgi:hypothetical protein